MNLKKKNLKKKINIYIYIYLMEKCLFTLYLNCNFEIYNIQAYIVSIMKTT